MDNELVDRREIIGDTIELSDIRETITVSTSVGDAVLKAEYEFTADVASVAVIDGKEVAFTGKMTYTRTVGNGDPGEWLYTIYKPSAFGAIPSSTPKLFEVMLDYGVGKSGLQDLGLPARGSSRFGVETLDLAAKG